jgi:hypothetical protein
MCQKRDARAVTFEDERVPAQTFCAVSDIRDMGLTICVFPLFFFCAESDIRDMDLTIYDTQPGQAWGATQAANSQKCSYIGTLYIKYTRHLTVENGSLYQEFFSAARLDNQV